MDLHPSHEWLIEEENDFRYSRCSLCLNCSCCGDDKLEECPGEWDPEEVSNDED